MNFLEHSVWFINISMVSILYLANTLRSCLIFCYFGLVQNGIDCSYCLCLASTIDGLGPHHFQLLRSKRNGFVCDHELLQLVSSPWKGHEGCSNHHAQRCKQTFFSPLGTSNKGDSSYSYSDQWWSKEEISSLSSWSVLFSHELFISSQEVKSWLHDEYFDTPWIS